MKAEDFILRKIREDSFRNTLNNIHWNNLGILLQIFSPSYWDNEEAKNIIDNKSFLEFMKGFYVLDEEVSSAGFYGGEKIREIKVIIEILKEEYPINSRVPKDSYDYDLYCKVSKELREEYKCVHALICSFLY